MRVEKCWGRDHKSGSSWDVSLTKLGYMIGKWKNIPLEMREIPLPNENYLVASGRCSLSRWKSCEFLYCQLGYTESPDHYEPTHSESSINWS
jgi:hypothetical protein